METSNPRGHPPGQEGTNQGGTVCSVSIFSVVLCVKCHLMCNTSLHATTPFFPIQAVHGNVIFKACHRAIYSYVLFLKGFFNILDFNISSSLHAAELTNDLSLPSVLEESWATETPVKHKWQAAVGCLWGLLGETFHCIQANLLASPLCMAKTSETNPNSHPSQELSNCWQPKCYFVSRMVVWHINMMHFFTTIKTIFMKTIQECRMSENRGKKHK